MILRSRKHQVDWDRLVRLSRERRLTLPLRDALAYLRQSLDAPVPAEVLSDLQNAPTSRLERQFYRIRLGPNDALRTIPVLWHWCGSLRMACDGTIFQRLAQFLHYLRSLWGISRTRDIPSHLAERLIRRTYQLFRWRLRGKWAATRPAE
jgi:hypothetical protein